MQQSDGPEYCVQAHTHIIIWL